MIKRSKNTGCNVGKIPRDHKGLYACEPFNHGIQQSVSKKSGVSSKERKDPSITDGNV